MLLVSCGSSDHFYRLSAEAPASRGQSSLSLGVGPIALPSYVDRTELVYQSGPNEFQVPPNERWAGSLRDNMSQVLATDLQRILGAREVLAYPWPAGRGPHYQIVADVRQFHGVSGDDAVLDLSWQVINTTTNQSSPRHSASLQEPIHGDGYAAVVAAESRLLGRCAEEMARSLRARD